MTDASPISLVRAWVLFCTGWFVWNTWDAFVRFLSISTPIGGIVYAVFLMWCISSFLSWRLFRAVTLVGIFAFPIFVGIVIPYFTLKGWVFSDSSPILLAFGCPSLFFGVLCFKDMRQP